MKIAINGKTVLRLPTRILMSRMVRGKINKYVPDKQQQLTIQEILLYLCKHRRQYKGWVLVDIESHNGEGISIIL